MWLVACDPAENARYFRERPAVVFEVPSPDTETGDESQLTVLRRSRTTQSWPGR